MRAWYPFSEFLRDSDKSKKLLLFLIVGALLFVWKPSCFAKNLKFGVFPHAGHPWAAGVEEFKEQIEHASQKRTAIEIISKEKPISPMKLIRGVQEGEIDIALLSAFYLGNIVDSMKIFRLPFLFRDKVQALPFTHGNVAKELLIGTREYGLAGIGFVSSEVDVLLNTIRPIKTPDDLNGLKVRAAVGYPIHLQAVKALGAIPVTTPRADAIPVLVHGAVSVAQGPPSLFFETKSYEIAKYMTIFPSFYNPGVIIANQKMWKNLSTDERALIEKYITFMTASIDNKVELRTLSAINGMKKFGVALAYPADIKAFRQAVKPVFEMASKELPKQLRLIAYNTAYVERELEVCSKPQKAKISYRRYGETIYHKHDSLTDTELTLEYAAWQIKLEKEGYYPEESLFDPYVNPKWRIKIDLRPKKP